MNAELHRYGGHERTGRKQGKDGKVFVAGSATAIDCTIRDITTDGALVRLPLSGEVPDRFELAIPSSNSLIPVRVVGRSQEGVSLVFAGPARPLRPEAGYDANPSGYSINERTVGGAGPADGAASPGGHKISAGFGFFFTPDLIDSTKGWCRIEVTIRNSGSIVAHQPFLCLPLLGLRLEAAKGWLAQDVTSIRKMRRFSQPGVHDLAAGGSTHCCNIVLPFTSGNGGSLEYEAGAKHALSNLPDLRLTCIAGAGNYPSNRVPFIVPALEIRKFFTAIRERGQIPAFEGAESPNNNTAVA